MSRHEVVRRVEGNRSSPPRETVRRVTINDHVTERGGPTYKVLLRRSYTKIPPGRESYDDVPVRYKEQPLSSESSDEPYAVPLVVRVRSLETSFSSQGDDGRRPGVIHIAKASYDSDTEDETEELFNDGVNPRMAQEPDLESDLARQPVADACLGCLEEWVDKKRGEALRGERRRSPAHIWVGDSDTSLEVSRQARKGSASLASLSRATSGSRCRHDPGIRAYRVVPVSRGIPSEAPRRLKAYSVEEFKRLKPEIQERPREPERPLILKRLEKIEVRAANGNSKQLYRSNESEPPKRYASPRQYELSKEIERARSQEKPRFTELSMGPDRSRGSERFSAPGPFKSSQAPARTEMTRSGSVKVLVESSDSSSTVQVNTQNSCNSNLPREAPSDRQLREIYEQYKRDYQRYIEAMKIWENNQELIQSKFGVSTMSQQSQMSPTTSMSRRSAEPSIEEPMRIRIGVSGSRGRRLGRGKTGTTGGGGGGENSRVPFSSRSCDSRPTDDREYYPR